MADNDQMFSVGSRWSWRKTAFVGSVKDLGEIQ